MTAGHIVVTLTINQGRMEIFILPQINEYFIEYCFWLLFKDFSTFSHFSKEFC